MHATRIAQSYARLAGQREPAGTRVDSPRSMSASGTPSRLRRGSLVFVASILVAAAAAEVFARACLPPPRSHENLVMDPELGFVALPCAPVEFRDERGAYTCALNALGSRGPDLPPPGSEPSLPRILLLGDS